MTWKEAGSFIRRWGPAILCMVFIFLLSTLPGERKDSLISAWVAALQSLLPGVDLGRIDWTVVEHAAIFLCLGMALMYVFIPRGRMAPWWALGTAALYGATDEVHQIFIPGRSSTVSDWLTDVIGAALGILIVLLIMKITPATKQKKTLPLS
jgi:VanZ family protein